MRYYDYLHIKGLDEAPDVNFSVDSLFECFQGIGAGEISTSEEPEEPETPEEEVDIEALQNWLDAVENWFDEEEQWIDDTIATVEGTRGLPAPVPPKLPDLLKYISLPALVAKFGYWGIVAWVGLQIVRRILEAWIEKKLNPSVGDELKGTLEAIRDAIKTGLLYDNGEKSIMAQALLYDTDNKSVLQESLLYTEDDGKKYGVLAKALLFQDVQGVIKSAVDVGLIFHGTDSEGNPIDQAWLERVSLGVEDLSMVDAVIDFGAFRLHVKGKVIEY